eukprot:TRINITY_DN7602_c0_g1_i1.p1 TRINITY_DN7602_c0_g1~~TRINITY_DN7602_c0_g1_i1.p1  ORF type:complete len:281 (+),score=94.34 TRINITY_DN7602_c0_g1_i1:93-935(+)
MAVTSLRTLVLALFAGTALGEQAANGGSIRKQLRLSAGASEEHDRHDEGFVKSLNFKHRLRVCNAYPYSAALDVYRSEEKFTNEAPMGYKTCRDFQAPLKAGDKLEFKVGDASAGTFSVSDLPNNDAVLLLVIHRHDTLSTAVAFESHVFANLKNAQVAIIDTYKGKARATPKIKDGKAGKNARSEELRYNSVVAVNPGKYDVVLDDLDKQVAKQSLVALDHESYVVLRTGVEAQQGESFPEELIIFPQSDPSQLPHQSAAYMPAAPLMALVLTVLSTLF